MAEEEEEQSEGARATLAPPPDSGIAKAIRRFFGEFNPHGSIPTRPLYHYTDINGLKGIVQGHQLWASDVEFMNDKTELLHGKDVVRRVLRSARYKNHRSRVVREVTQRAARAMSGNTLNRVFAVCFCEKPDQLSQWRGYADRGFGVSIGFSPPMLQGLTPGPLELIRVIYSPQQKRLNLDTSIAAYIDATLTDDLVLDDRSLARATGGLVGVLERIIPAIKNVGFKEEREWRLVLAMRRDHSALDTITSAHSQKHGAINHRAAGSKVIPYVPIQRPTYEKEPSKTDDVGEIILASNFSRLPIEEVVVGPVADPHLTTAGVLDLLKRNSYWHTKMRISRIPFRA